MRTPPRESTRKQLLIGKLWTILTSSWEFSGLASGQPLPVLNRELWKRLSVSVNGEGRLVVFFVGGSTSTSRPRAI